MLLDAVIIVLREVLEAALIISVLLVSNHLLKESRRWILPAIGSGVVLSIVLATQIGRLSEMFEGAGQEYVHCVIILITALCLLLRCAEILFESVRLRLGDLYVFSLGLAVALAISREGEEIFIYGYAFAAHAQSRFHIILGTAIGAGIGLSVGVLCYYSLLALKGRYLMAVLLGVMALISAGMVAQVVTNLMQAGLIASQAPAWNSTWLVDESTLSGQLLSALFSYESTPTLFQVSAYAAIIAAVLLMALLKSVSARWR